MVLGTVTRLVYHVGANGEVYKTLILTTYCRCPQGDYEDLDVECQSFLFVIYFCSLLTLALY